MLVSPAWPLRDTCLVWLVCVPVRSGQWHSADEQDLTFLLVLGGLAACRPVGAPGGRGGVHSSHGFSCDVCAYGYALWCLVFEKTAVCVSL